MSNAIFSIKPLYADRIFALEKQVEFRKIRCKREIKKMFIYVTSPVQKVIGEAYVSQILELPPEELWQKTQSVSGISKNDYDAYFKGRPVAYGYCLTRVKRYVHPLSLMDFGITTPPQSFYYISAYDSDPNLTQTHTNANSSV